MSQSDFLPYLLLASIALALWQWTRIRTRTKFYQLLGLLIGLACFTEAVGIALRALDIGNVLLYNGFALTEMLILLTMVHALHPAWKGWLLAAGGAGVAAMALSWIAHPGTAFALTEGIVAIALLLTTVCLAVLWSMAQSSRESLAKVPEFWLFMGFLIYFGGMPPLMGVIRSIYETDPHLANQLYAIIPSICIVRYLFTALACRMAAKAGLQYRDA